MLKVAFRAFLILWATLNVVAQEPSFKEKRHQLDPSNKHNNSISSSVVGYSDETIGQLPLATQVIRLRGNHGYGVDNISDEGVKQLTKYPDLRVLHLGGMRLTDACLDTISKLEFLEDIGLDSNLLTGEGLAKLARLPRLEKLNISNNPLNPDWSRELSSLKMLVELRAVAHDLPIDDQTLEDISKLSRLRILEINDSASEVTDKGLTALAGLVELTTVDISDAIVSAKTLESLSQLKELRKLRLRNLRGIDPGSLAWLAKLKKLRDLELVGLPLNAGDLAATNQLNSLENLLIWNASWGSDPLSISALDGLKSLRTFRTTEVIEPSAIDDLSHIPTMQYLGDGLTKVTDADVEKLAKLPSLRYLFLDSSRITDRSLASLARMRSLKFLSVSEGVQLTAHQLEVLGREHLTDCQIVSMRGNRVFYQPPVNN